MIEDLLGLGWRLVKRTWAKREFRLHVVTWGITSLMALGLYLYIGFRVSELRASADEGKRIEVIQLGDLKDGIVRVESKVDQVYGYLLQGSPNRRPARDR